MPRKSRLEKPLEWYPWNPLQWQSSRKVQRMTWAEKGLYRELMDECYLKGSIPVDPEAIAELLGEPLQAIEGLLLSVLRCFQERDGRLISPPIEEIREEQTEARLARAGRRRPQVDQSGPVGTSRDQSSGPGTSQVVQTPQGPLGQDRIGQDIKELPPNPLPGGTGAEGLGIEDPSPPPAKKAKPRRRTRDPLPLNRVGGTELEAFEEARACWPLEIHGWNSRTNRNETRKVSIGNVPTAQRFFLQLIQEGHATAQELYTCAYVAVEEWKRTGYLWVPHLSTFFGPEKETWAQFLPAARKAIAELLEVG